MPKFYGTILSGNALTGEIKINSIHTGEVLFEGVVDPAHHRALERAIRIAEKEALKAAANDCRAAIRNLHNA